MGHKCGAKYLSGQAQLALVLARAVAVFVLITT